MDNQLDVVYVLRDLAHLVSSVEGGFYDPNIRSARGNDDGVRVSTGNNAGVSTQAPCDVSHLDLLVKLDSVLSLLPGEIGESTRSEYLSRVALELEEEQWPLGARGLDQVTACWTEFRQFFGLVVAGQRSLHEPMTLNEVAMLLGQPIRRVTDWADQGRLERWVIDDQVLWQIPRL